MSACNDVAVLITLRAAGALEPFEVERVEKHLAACERCRAEAAADAEVLGLARLPPLSDVDERVARVRPGRALEALRARDARRESLFRWASVVAVAAAVLLAVLAPALVLMRRTPVGPSRDLTAAAATAAWESPDLDTIWEDTSVLDLDATSSSDASDTTTYADAALAAASM